MSIAKRITMFEKLYHPLTHDVETYLDIKRFGLTLVEYNESIDILKALSGIKGNQASETIMQNVADLFRKYGFMVKEKGIGWIISFE